MITLIKNVRIVNEGKTVEGELLIENDIIKKIYYKPDTCSISDVDRTIDGEGKYLIPGVIDDQVHFREPGLTHKADIYHESKAAVTGGTTSFMEMPNTSPNTVTIELLEDKYKRASESSLANYSFYMGATNDNIEELLKVNPKEVCGVKVFMGSSTGNMLVDNLDSLNKIFSQVKIPIATHCEDEQTIKENERIYKKKYGYEIPMSAHPEIRSEEACYKSSSLAVSLAKKHGSRLHVLHLSTAKELELFDNSKPLEEKKITGEICVHHLWFDSSQYDEKGALMKWNPAVKTAADRDALFEAMMNDTLDVIATDHAPHTLKEKDNLYMKAPSGGPSVQYSLTLMLEFVYRQKMTIEKIVEKMCHAPAICFNISNRGYIREGYKADIVLVDTDVEWELTREDAVSKCHWSPFEGEIFHSKVTHTFVSGHLVYENGNYYEDKHGERLEFDR